MADRIKASWSGNRLSRRRSQGRFACLAAAVSVVAIVNPNVAHAASATWNTSPTTATWEAGAGENNWSTGVNTFPGALNDVANLDIATFLTSGTTTISVNSTTGNSSPLGIKGITFGATPSPSAFTIGSTSGNALFLASGGQIGIASGSTVAGAIETINAPLVLEPGSSSTAGTYTFSNASALAGSVLNIGGPITTGVTSSTATLTLTGGNTSANTVTGTITQSAGTAAGGFILAKTSSGTWTFGGNGTSSLAKGSIQVSGGTFNFGSVTDAPTMNITTFATGNTAVDVSGGTFNMTNGTLQANSTIYGLILEGSQTYTQTGGTLSSTGIDAFANGGGSSVVNVSGGTLSDSFKIELAVRGTTAFTLSGTGIVTTPLLVMNTTQLGSGTASGTFNLNGGTLTVGQIVNGTGGPTGIGNTFNFNGGTLKSSASSTTFMTGITNAFVKSGGAIIDTQVNNETIGQSLLTDVVSIGGGLNKLGGGTLTLAGTNTYTGATTVSAGSLKAGSTSAYGNNSAVTLANVAGAGLDITGFNNAIGSLTGGGATGGNVTLGASTLTVGGDNSSPAAYAGIISGSGGGLTKTGSGTLTLSGANSYTGATSVNGGTLKAGVITTAFGINSAVTLANVAGATLDITGFNNSIGSLTGGGSTGGTVTLGAATLTVGGDNTSPASYAGTISGTGTLAKVGTGTLIIGGTGTSTAGNITVNNSVNSAGGLTFGSATESPTLTLSGSGLTINSNGTTGALAPNFNMAGGTLGLGSSNGAFTMNTGTYSQTGGAVTVSGAGISYLANAGSTQTSVFNLSGGSFTASSGGYFFGSVRGTSTISLSGTGVFTAPLFSALYGGSGVSNSASNTVNLGNGVAGGTFVVNAVSNNVNGASTGTSTFNFNGGTLKASASSTTFMTGLTNAFIKAGGAIIDTQANNDTIGQTLLTDAVSTGGGLTKLGSGTLTLSNANNTYTGATTVQTGTLALLAANNNNLNASSRIVVGIASGSTAALTVTGLSSGSTGLILNSSQALAGFGTVNGNITTGSSSSTIAPGNNSNGLLTVNGNFSLANTGKLAIDLDKTVNTGAGAQLPGADYDRLAVTTAHSVDVTGGVLALSIGSNVALGDVFYVLDNQGAGAITGTFGSGTINGTNAAISLISGSQYNFSAGTFTFTLNYADHTGGSGTLNDISLTATAVPEPASLAGLALGAGCLLSRKRRIRKA